MPRVRQPKDVAGRVAKSIATAALAAQEGTEDVLRDVRADFLGQPAWGPLRAAIAHAEAKRPWMTTEQFQTWLLEQDILRKRRVRKSGLNEFNPTQALEIGAKRRRNLLHGHDLPTKAEAMAFAHFAARLPLPLDPDDTEAFGAWFAEHFVGVKRVSDWMEIDPRPLTAATQGFFVQRNTRIPYRISVVNLRALDWMRRFGPFVPYGENPPSAVQFRKEAAAC